MIQENGMPMKFQAWDEERKKFVRPSESAGGIISVEATKEGFELKTKFMLSQAIGATSSDDPKQRLYLGDLVEFEYAGRIVGEIVWKDWAVVVRYRPLGEYGIGRKRCRYLGFKTVLEHQFAEKRQRIKKLGSRYTKEGKEVLKKAGLLENEDQ